MSLPDNALLLISIGAVLWACLEFSWRGCRVVIRWYHEHNSKMPFSNELQTVGRPEMRRNHNESQTSKSEPLSHDSTDPRQILRDSVTSTTSTLPRTPTEGCKIKSTPTLGTVTGRN